MYAVGVAMIGHVAVYIIVPDIILGLSTYITFDIIRERPLWMIAIAAVLVMILYLGCAVLSFFMIERVLLGT
jgi:ABC-type spermidine/putrescine transport system permease subunit II